MNTKSEIFKRLSELKPDLHKEFHLKKIGVFGSFADETNTEDSDIDILVEFDKPIGWKFFTLEIYLEKIPGRKIDLVTRNALKEHIKDNILKQTMYV